MHAQPIRMTNAEMSLANLNTIPGTSKRASSDLSDLPPLVTRPSKEYDQQNSNAKQDGLLNTAPMRTEKTLVKNSRVGYGTRVGNGNGDKLAGHKRAASTTDENEHDAKRWMMPGKLKASTEASATNAANEAKTGDRKWTISKVFSAVLVITRLRFRIEDIAEKVWEENRDEFKKHAPITGKNVHFRWSDNTHINSKPFAVGETARRNEVRLRLKDQTGKLHLYRYTRKVDWADSKSISHVNSWRRQIFRRCLNKAEDNNPSRPCWTIKEKNYLNYLVDYKKSLAQNEMIWRNDWEAIANAHNSKFQGKTLPHGEPLARSKVAGSLSRPGQTLKNPKPLPARTIPSMKNILVRWEGVSQNVVSSAVAPSGTSNTAGNSPPSL